MVKVFLEVGMWDLGRISAPISTPKKWLELKNLGKSEQKEAPFLLKMTKE